MTMTAQHRKEKIKLVEKEKRKKTAEELIEKSKKAFNSKLVVEIVEKALVNKDGKVNLTKVHDQVFEHVFEQTKDLKTAKEFAVAARWLAMLKQNYPADFEELLYEKEMEEHRKSVTEKDLAIKLRQPEPKPKPKKVEIELFGDIIFSSELAGMPHISTVSLRILRTDLIFNGIKMAADLLESITGIEPSSSEDRNWPEVKMGFALNYHPNDEFSEANRLSALRDYLIQILEEKSGLTIKICGNCKYFRPRIIPEDWEICVIDGEELDKRLVTQFSRIGCFRWISKEIPSERKEEEKNCGNCKRWIARVTVGNTTYCESSNNRIITSVTPACEIWGMEK